MGVVVKMEKTENLEGLIKPLLGKKCWQARKGHGSFLTFDFGKVKIPSRPSRSRFGKKRMLPAKGEWHLWIMMCEWVIKRHNIMIAHSESSDEDIENIVSQIKGLKIEKIGFYQDSDDSLFVFENGYTIQTHPYEDGDENDEQWLLFTPNNYVISYANKNSWTYELSSKSKQNIAQRERGGIEHTGSVRPQVETGTQSTDTGQQVETERHTGHGETEKQTAEDFVLEAKKEPINFSVTSGGTTLTTGNNFKDHFLSKKKNLGDYLDTNYRKLGIDSPRFLEDIAKITDDKTVEFIGLGTYKKGVPPANIYRGNGLTVIVKPSGEWVTLLKSGEGMDTAIKLINPQINR